MIAACTITKSCSAREIKVGIRNECNREDCRNEPKNCTRKPNRLKRKTCQRVGRGANCFEFGDSKTWHTRGLVVGDLLGGWRQLEAELHGIENTQLGDVNTNAHAHTFIVMSLFHMHLVID